MDKDQRLPVFLRLGWDWYLTQLRMSPIFTKTITAAVLSALGNFIAQKVVERKALDLRRLVKFSTAGAFLTPLGHYWFNFLEKIFKGSLGNIIQISSNLCRAIASYSSIWEAPRSSSLFRTFKRCFVFNTTINI